MREFLNRKYDKINSMIIQNPYKQLSEEVAARIRSLLAEGKIRPGEWLRQEHLAQVVGVSHTPFREAVKLLVAEGLLEHLPHRGVRVIQFSVQDIEDIYTVRSTLEAKAAREAAVQIKDDELKMLEDILLEMEENLAAEQISHYREINLNFHQRIYTASRRQFLIRTLNQIWAFSPTMLWAQFAPTASTPLSSRTTADPTEHRNILKALQNHDADAVEKLVRDHIETAGRELIRAIKEE